MNKIFVLLLIATTMCFATRIGVLKGKDACAEQITIHLDTEDNNPSNKFIEPELEPGERLPTTNMIEYGIDLQKSKITFRYCVLNVPDSSLVNGEHAVSYDYAVLMLDTKCPLGAHKFKRHHDTEDKNNQNYYEGNISPNVVNRDADLFYCFVPATLRSPKSYPFEGYGIFAKTYNTAYIITNGKGQSFQTEISGIYIDDEDKNNENSWNYYGYSPESGPGAIIDGTKNTTMFVSYWGTISNAFGIAISKNGSMDNSATNAGADQLAAPTIKGLDHTAIAVDLKSAGDVSISVTNANGAVVANIAENNLQPGVHQIKWHAGAIPNGRYIVTIKQNGMVNAKNVILK